MRGRLRSFVRLIAVLSLTRDSLIGRYGPMTVPGSVRSATSGPDGLADYQDYVAQIERAA